MNMEMLDSHIDGIKIIKPRFTHEFSSYSDVYNYNIFSQELDIDDEFIIDQQVTAPRGEIIGIYSQMGKDTQSYLIRCIKGSAFCVFVDMRIDSDSYGEYFSMLISENDQLQIYACEGFAIGYMSMTDSSTVIIKTNKEWNPDNCQYISYDDDELKIDWLIDNSEISYGFKNTISFDDAEKF